MPDKRPTAVIAHQVPLRTTPSNYPEPFASLMAAREKRPLGTLFGLNNLGVNLTRLKPGAVSALRHAHSRQDEFIYILEGRPTLLSDQGETLLAPGLCAGSAAGSGDAHCLVNRSEHEVVYLEIGDRSPGDAVSYPDDDLVAMLGDDGRWRFEHKDGQPY